MMNENASMPACEVSWFSALCDDDYEFLGVPDEALKSSFEHCRNIFSQFRVQQVNGCKRIVNG